MPMVQNARPNRRHLRRQHDLRDMLERRYRELASQVKGTIREARTDGPTTRPGTLTGESEADVDAHGDIDLTIAQLKADSLGRVAAALARLDEGRYGLCSECGDEIPEARLVALPFAVRCLGCEATREEAGQARAISERARMLRSLS